MKRPDKRDGGENPVGVITDEKWAKLFPTLIQYMTDGKWEDGKVRELSTLSINFSTGMATVGLSDHALSQSCYSTADTVEAALKLLEKALAEEKVSWRRWKVGKAKS